MSLLMRFMRRTRSLGLEQAVAFIAQYSKSAWIIFSLRHFSTPKCHRLKADRPEEPELRRRHAREIPLALHRQWVVPVGVFNQRGARSDKGVCLRACRFSFHLKFRAHFHQPSFHWGLRYIPQTKTINLRFEHHRDSSKTTNNATTASRSESSQQQCKTESLLMTYQDARNHHPQRN